MLPFRPQSEFALLRGRLRLFPAAAFSVLVFHAQALAQTVDIASWNFTGQSSVVTSTASASDSNLAAVPILTRGPGAAASSGNNSFRTVGFQNNGIALSNTDYFQVTLTAAANFSLSLSSIDARLAGTASFAASPGVSNQFAYSLDGTNFTLIGAPVIVVGAPATMPQVNLSGVSALQNIPQGTTVTLRFYASGQTTSGGWGFNSPDASTSGFVVRGSINSASPNAPTITGFSPQSGSAGTVVNITGTNFIAAGTTVRFGAVQATSVTVSSPTSLSVTVPAGAVTGRIALTTANGTASSASDFVIIDGSGTATVQNATAASAFSGRNIFARAASGQTLRVLYAPPSAGSIEGLSVTLPSGFSGLSQANVGVSGGGGTPSVSVSGQTATISGLAATNGNNVTINLGGLTTPDTSTPITNSGNYNIAVSSRGSGGTLAPIAAPPAARVLIPIANAQNRDAANGYVPTLAGQTVAVEGVCNVGKLANRATSTALQDATHGIAIDSTVVQGPQTPGNRYAVVGPVSNFNGLAQISLAANEDIIDLGPAAAPSPVTATVPEFNTVPGAFNFQSRVVRVDNLTKVSGTWAVNQNVVLQDTSANQITVRIVANSTATTEPSYPVTIVGVAGQFDNATPFDTGFQLQPRDPADLQSPSGPRITVSPGTISNLAAIGGSPGTPQPITVTSAELTAGINVAVNSANYQVAVGGSGNFDSSATLPSTGGTIDVRIASGVAAGPVAASAVTFNSTGAAERSVSISGTVTDPNAPNLSVSPASLTNFVTTAGAASAAKTFTVTGTNLQGDVVVTPPTGYQVSLDGNSWTSTLTVPRAYSAFDDFYVNVPATGGNSNYTQATWIANAGTVPFDTGLTNANTWGYAGGNFNGAGGAPASVGTYLPVAGGFLYPLTSGGTYAGPGASYDLGGGSFWIGYNDQYGVVVPGLPNAQTQIGKYTKEWFSGSPNWAANSNGVNGKFLWLQGTGITNTTDGLGALLTWTAPSSGTFQFSGSYINGNNAGQSTSFAIVDSLNNTLLAKQTLAPSSSTNSFGFTRTYSAGDVVQFQVGTPAASQGSPLGLSVEVTPAVAVSRIVYVRIAPTAPVGLLAGNVSVTSTGANTQNVAVSGTVAAAPVGPIITVSTNTLSGFLTQQGTTSTNQTVTVGGTNLQSPITVTAPANYEISTNSAGPFTGTVTLNGTGGGSPAVIGVDSAANYGTPAGNTWTNGANLGSGFQPWVFSITDNSSANPPPAFFAGAFLGDPNSAGITGFGTNAFGFYANPAGTAASASVERAFAAPLGVGNTFSFQWAVNWDADGGNKGFSILEGTNQLVNVNQGGFPGNITFNGTNTAIAFGTGPMTWTFSRPTADTLQVASSARNGTTAPVFTTNIAITSAPTGFRWYASAMGAGDQRQPYFNNPQITSAGGGGGTVPATALYVRLRADATAADSVGGALTAASPGADRKSVV